MPSGYYDLYAEAGSLFVVNLNFLTIEGESANLAYLINRPQGSTLYIPEELSAIGWNFVTEITATMQVKKKPTADASGTPLITFNTTGTGYGTVGKIELVDTSIGTDLKPKSDYNIRIWKKEPLVTDTGTFFYDLELQFKGGSTSSSTDIVKLRILQGRFTITPQVTF